MSSYRNQEKNEGRVKRVPFSGPRLKLQLSDEDRKEFEKRGMVPRWINDQDGRIQRAKAGGYTDVDPKYAESVGSSALHQGNTSKDSRVSIVVSKGEPIINAYLMELKKEYYDEDQKAKQDRNDLVDETLRGGNAGGADVENAYGSGVTYQH